MLPYIGSLPGQMMKTPLLVLAILLQGVYEASSISELETCGLVPLDQLIQYGSELRVSFRAPPNGDCRKMPGFDASRLKWTLNNQEIPQSFYNSSSTLASVFIPSFTLTKGTVECHLDERLLGGTIIRTYSVPENVSCIAKRFGLPVYVTCEWDYNQQDVNTNYTVDVKQNGTKLPCQPVKQKSCKFQIMNLDKEFKINVTAHFSGREARSEEVTYPGFWPLFKLDPPTDIQVQSELTGLNVTWSTKESYSECEVRFLEKGFEPVVKSVEEPSMTVDLPEVKPCTIYTIAVRCRIEIWSEWSQSVTHLTGLNVSNVQLHLWRSKSDEYDQGKRTVHLMWKGIHPSCQAFDEYRLLNHAHGLVTSQSFKPSENHTFITLDENAHRITLAAFRNNESLSEVSIEIPSTEEDLDLPPVKNVSMFVRNSQIHVTWDKPSLSVIGYIIVWDSTEKDHQQNSNSKLQKNWQQTQERHFSLPGKNFTLYTISLTPLYENGPGSEIRLHNYVQEGEPAAVSNVRAERISDRKAKIHWRPILPTQCCAFVVNYTVVYKTQTEAEFRYVPVDGSKDSVILDGLQPKTNYIVYVQANSTAAFSKSSHCLFSTKPYGEVLLIMFIVCGVGLMLLPICTVFAVLIRREYLSEKVPNPRFSSLSIWSSQKCRNPWNQLPMPWGCDYEKKLTCQMETEDYSILVTSTSNVAKVKQKTALHETTTETKSAAQVSSSSEMDLASDSEKKRMQPLLAVDLQKTKIRPGLTNQSPYRNQTPATSPVDSPRIGLHGAMKPHSSEETMTLLKPKPQNNLVSTYVTMDMFDHGNGQSN
ncbi:hypothetical protein NFI96_033550 [Prochilodus magdalenae]|nr:hypothetical protein NFI96_033550 [Prochilodus magdalenae]